MSNSLMGNMLVEHVMEKAMRDKAQKQQKEQQEQLRKARQQMDSEEEEDEDYKELMQNMKAAQLREFKADHAKQQQKLSGIGEYREIAEDEFLPSVTKNDLAVVHFYHTDFEKCKLMDKHLRAVAEKHPETKFFYINAEKTPFFIQKLQIQVLPTVCLFKKGINVHKIVGFQELGGKETFETYVLVRILDIHGVIKIKKVAKDDSDSDEDK